ncbi:hypothetical protein RhiirA4_476891 [Rhizophagus irregularis]|uniref:Uncharacterized protein n=1 Tax=Rhizophagus irregularis TaxID=588596 RepID=A0A2I1HCF1_9GLOM|nr:hypothetical protein RhiirA4_476891 [Rhizophagus irregularis]
MIYTILHPISFRFCWKKLRMCRVVSESRLSWINSPHQLKIKIEGATEADLSQEVVKNRDMIFDLLKPHDHVLYYHTPDLSSPEDSPERYYQLIVTDDLWLKNYCFCIDENNELNIMEQATILVNYPLAFHERLLELNYIEMFYTQIMYLAEIIIKMPD